MPGGRRVREAQALARGRSRERRSNVRSVEDVSAARGVYRLHVETSRGDLSRLGEQGCAASPFVDDDLADAPVQEDPRCILERRPTREPHDILVEPADQAASLTRLEYDANSCLVPT